MKAGRRRVRFGFRLRLRLKTTTTAVAAKAVQGGCPHKFDDGSAEGADAASEPEKKKEADIVRLYAREVTENRKEREEHVEYAELDDEHGELFSSPWRKAPPNCVWSHRLRCYVPKSRADDGVVGALRFEMPCPK